ncbi:uncharacterized protein TRIADDRAFT_28719 [Trichoplax adhaerens]|uniref:GYF domain-containing protein n=1 Tax=Trichoplax adhaerens TaxID=10228 RepID=B3S4G1_TRIAD|nr:hypothetical protein TRIADDRAFT_28719 [Trichoplax adhaerens]EDV22630.1 hypothetical protein TRIADDRAFT_28719 [Trichoplax adhaerens]|eukprot:XP_002115174.1 hypothetical protein TRIADDRAFT_28719 [Trichoplax adhaerens]
MSKRKGVRFDEENLQALASDDVKRFKSKHSLDSDEEDDRKQVDKLNEDDIEGQEDETETYTDDGMKITPFNLKEELEEGYFDAEGNYFANKDDDVSDNWLQAVDWNKIKNQSNKIEQEDSAQSEKVDKLPPDGILNALKELAAFLLPKETPIRAIRRFGGNKGSSASQKWKLKKERFQPADIAGTANTEKEEDNRKKCERITEITDLLLHNDRTNIYHENLEYINHQISLLSEKSKDENNDTVNWFYKWKDEEDAEVFGPYSSAQMLDWTNQGYFPDGVFARRAETEDSLYYTSKRIDFDLYT